MICRRFLRVVLCWQFSRQKRLGCSGLGQRKGRPELERLEQVYDNHEGEVEA